MDDSDVAWETIAARLSAADFIATYSCSFLAYAEPLAEEEVAFRTKLAGKEPRTVGDEKIVAISKSARNPYADRVSIGRARNSDVVLRHASVSKLHAHFRYGDEGLTLTDVGSHNGTKIGGKALVAHRPEIVVVGQAITIGRVDARVLSAAAAYENLRRR